MKGIDNYPVTQKKKKKKKIQALQAKVVSRLMEPERLAWKVFQLHHLSNAPHTRALAYGATILFSTVSIGCMQLPARLKGYVTAFKALQPHRLHQVNAMPAEDILNEPLFFNQQISVPLGSSATGSADDSTTSRPLTPHDQPSMLAAGITKVAHLRVALKQQHPPAFAACLQSMLMTMPPSWQAVVVTAPTAPTWQQGLSASGNQLIQNTQTGQCHSLTSHGQLQQSNVKAASAAHPVRVISWDPSRPWRGPTRQPTESASTTLYSQGQLWGPNHLSMGVWGWGQQPAHLFCLKGIDNYPVTQKKKKKTTMLQAIAHVVSKGKQCHQALLASFSAIAWHKEISHTSTSALNCTKKFLRKPQTPKASSI